MKAKIYVRATGFVTIECTREQFEEILRTEPTDPDELPSGVYIDWDDALNLLDWELEDAEEAVEKPSGG